MAGDTKKLQPIIVKRIKKGGHGHHGGAWKIAYADFVTAMMAFFLLMWLLGSTTEGDKKGIADYFNSPLKIALLASGSGAGDASHVVNGGGKDLSSTTGQVKGGDMDAQRNTINLHKLKQEQVRAEIARLEDLKKKVEAKIAANMRLAAMSEQIRLDMTRDGLRIQIVDDQNRPMFPVGRGLGGERQREISYRFGVNLVMHVLTGNYKSDQVHVPALLETLDIEGVTFRIHRKHIAINQTGLWMCAEGI